MRVEVCIDLFGALIVVLDPTESGARGSSLPGTAYTKVWNSHATAAVLRKVGCKSLFCGIYILHFTLPWKVLDTLLKEWRKDRTNKVLIFTKSVKLLDMLEFHLNTNSMKKIFSVSIEY